METSIIIRAYNAQDTIERSLESALKQNISSDQYEIIIINDGSTDKTPTILQKYEGLSNLIIINQSNHGAIIAANKGLRKSRGEYVVLLDADDYFLPDLVVCLSTCLDKNQKTDYVYPDYWEEFEKKRRKIVPKNIFETLAGGTMFRRASLEAAGFYNKNVLLAEYDILLRMDKWIGYHYPKPLFVYCRRTNSISSNNEWFKEAIKQLYAIHPKKHSQIGAIRSYSIT